MFDLEKEIGTSPLNDLMDGVVRKRYHLLLGAGASVGGRGPSPNSRPMPKGMELANALNEDLHLGLPADHELKEVFAEAKAMYASTDAAELDDYLRAWFTQTTPPPWMSLLCQMPWSGIWTLNVDDCLERTYVANRRIARQSLISRSWSERHVQPGATEVTAIHLHGKASRGSRDLVFDLGGYLAAFTSSARWHKIFADEYSASPFIVVGASLRQEVDLYEILSPGKIDASGLPSILVSPNAADYERRQFKRWGLTYVDASAEELFGALRTLLPGYIDRLAHDGRDAPSTFSPQIEVFLNSWRELRVDAGKPTVRDRRQDFFAGHEPTWVDILEDRAFPRTRMRKLETVFDKAEPDFGKVVLLTGGPFSGKTTASLILARLLIASGYRVYQFAGDASPDLEATIWWLQNHPRSVLMIDGAGDLAMDVGLLLAESEATPSTVRVLMTERTSGRPTVERHIPSAALEVTHLPDAINGGERDELVKRLRKANRLGVLTPMNLDEMKAYFRDRQYLLFACMADLERGGRGFINRLVSERVAVKDERQANLLDAVSAANFFGYPLPARHAAKLAAATPSEVSAWLTHGAMLDLLHVTDGGISFRHKYFGERVFSEYLSPQQKFDVLQDIAVSLAPQVTRQAISTRGKDYLLARSIMSAESLTQLLGAKEALEWYGPLEPDYDWNARFWEQRALAAANNELWERAYSWAMLAVERRGKPDAYTFTTVAAILLRRCRAQVSLNYWPGHLFDEAIDYLSRAQQIEKTNSEYPVGTFFAHVPHLLEGHPIASSGLALQMREIWSIWRRHYQRLDPRAQRRVGQTVERAYLIWERLRLDG